jgi:glycosyltransferase involved in cell wall biosynthesis
MLTRAKEFLKRYRPFQLASDVHNCLIGSWRRHYKPEKDCFTLRPEGASKGNVLLSYMTNAYRLKPDEPIPTTHNRIWEAFQFAKTFVDLGYTVDVYSYLNKKFSVTKEYAVFIDVEDNMARLAPVLPKDCIKIFCITTAHPLFHNAAEANRLLALQRRKGVTLPGRRFFLKPHLGVEFADCCIIKGNDFTANTYQYAQKPFYRIPPSSSAWCTWPVEEDVEQRRTRFVWFGSTGMVHKGLDLVLEAFAEMPEVHLTVCGPIDSEPDFLEAYRKELYHTPNIEVVGWLDINSPQFDKVMRSCIGSVFCSCSEGGGGTVIDTMHAGLIPIVSYESSVDVNEFGVLLKQATVREIQEAVRMVSRKPADELVRRMKQARAYAQANHTPKRYAEVYGEVIQTILATQWRR